MPCCEPCYLRDRSHTGRVNYLCVCVCVSVHFLLSDLASLQLTNFADFGFSAEMMDGGQVKVSVLVYEGNLSFGGWPALVQSYLHHLQLHMNSNTHKNKGEGGTEG